MLRLSSVERNNKRLRTFQHFQHKSNRSTTASLVTLLSRHSLFASICLLIFGYTTLQLYSSLTLPFVYPDVPHEVISPPTEFIANRKVNTFRTTESVMQQHCQFTKQGINRACDSRGTICSRSAISEDTSCCREQMRGSERGSPEPMRHSCHGCDTEEVGCCGDYETCVSCCLRPDHIAQHISRTYIPSEVGFPSVILAALSNNDFEWCEYVCRTSSRSLLAAENSYSSSHVRHCYRLDSHAPNDQTGVNSDRASVCLKSQPGDASHHKASSATAATTATSAGTPLCRDGESYPIIQTPHPRNPVLRDYG